MLIGNTEQAVDQVLNAYHRPNMPGMAVGILQQGKVVLRKGYGLADIAQQRPNATNVPMRIASLSKQFLVALALQLEQEGALVMSASVHHYLPELPDYGVRVSLRDLAANQSGIRDFLEMRLLSGGNFAQPATAEESDVLINATHQLNFLPGTRFAYSNSGFLLLTRIIERVAGEPLEMLLQRYFFEPLGMAQTRLVRRDEPWLTGRAIPYVIEQGQPVQGRWSVPLDGAGGLISTVDDLLIWAAYVSDADSPHADIFSRMATAQPYADGTSSLYGLGFTVMPYRGQPSFGHHGQLPGVFAEIAWFPTLHTTIVLLANTDEINPFLLGRQLADAIFPETLAPQHPARPLTAGYYFCQEHFRALRIHHDEQGKPLIDSTMTCAPLEWHRADVFRPWWPMLHWQLTVQGDALAGYDGPDKVQFNRLEPPNTFDHERFIGRFRQVELKSEWVVHRVDDALILTLSGPFGSSQFTLLPLAEDLLYATPAVNPDGDYRLTLSLTGKPGERQLCITTDRTAGLIAHEIFASTCA